MPPDPSKIRTKRPDLSVEEIRFCQLYAETNNKTQAYLRANFTPPPPDDNAAHQRSRTLLRKHPIRKYIRDIQDAAALSAATTIEHLARGFKYAAEADVTVIFDEDGGMLPPKQWPKELRSAITGLEVDAIFEKCPETGRKLQVGNRYKIKLENKTEARKILSQWRGMIGGDKEDELMRSLQGEIADLKQELRRKNGEGSTASGDGERVGGPAEADGPAIRGEASLDDI